MLRHLNLLNGDFDLETICPQSFHNPVAHQIEMHLQFTNSTVVLQALNFKVSLAAGNYSH